MTENTFPNPLILERKFSKKLLWNFSLAFKNGKEINEEGEKFMMELRQEKEVLFYTTLFKPEPPTCH